MKSKRVKKSVHKQRSNPERDYSKASISLLKHWSNMGDEKAIKELNNVLETRKVVHGY